MREKLLTNRGLFAFVTIFWILVSFVSLLIKGGDCFQYYFFGDSLDSFMDFFNSVYQTPFSHEFVGIYPPLANFFYAICNLLMPSTVSVVANPTRNNVLVLRNSSAGAIMMLMFILVFVVLFFVTVETKARRENFGQIKQTNYLKVYFGLLSGPFLFAYERGNLILYAFLFALYYVLNYDSSDAKVRELSLVSLALSANLKIYPAIFSIFLIKDKRWKDFLKFCLYGFILLLLPSFAFKGGIRSIWTFLRNLLYFTHSNGGGFRYVPGANYSLANCWYWLDKLLFKFLGITLHLSNTLIPKLVVFAVLVLLVSYAYIASKRWVSTCSLVLLMVLIPGISYRYVFIFMSIPIVYLLQDETEFRPFITTAFATLMSVILVPLRYPDKWYGMTMSFIIDFLMLYLLVALVIKEGFSCVYAKRKFVKK